MSSKHAAAGNLHSQKEGLGPGGNPAINSTGSILPHLVTPSSRSWGLSDKMAQKWGCINPEFWLHLSVLGSEILDTESQCAANADKVKRVSGKALIETVIKSCWGTVRGWS